MIIDFRNLENEAEIDADICIIGAGAAGITMAREFIGSQLDVCLVESGGFEPDPETQALYSGKNIGSSYFPLDQTRLRYFGGSTNHWDGHVGELGEFDFEKRSWVPYSGWPINKAELVPYYKRARPVCSIEPHINTQDLYRQAGLKLPPFDQNKLQIHLRQFRVKSHVKFPVRFGQAYRDELEKSSTVKVFLHANVTNIVANEAGRLIESVECRSLTGRTGRVRARQFILACGGIENPRLLLLSNRHAPAGLGNQHDLVGRYFMEHQYVKCGLILQTSPGAFPDSLKGWSVRGNWYMPDICPSDALQKSEGILNFGTSVRYESIDLMTELKQAYHEIRDGNWPDDALIRSWFSLKEKVFEDTPTKYAHRLNNLQEQSPNPDSRVKLDQSKDAFGLNRVAVDLEFTELDTRTVQQSMTAIGAEIGRLDWGRVRNVWSGKFGGGAHHHMGTTRMADDPRFGVVNRDCKVHGIQNLYIAGSSVFPTGGYVNPTLTIVALALRIADHVKQQVATG